MIRSCLKSHSCSKRTERRTTNMQQSGPERSEAHRADRADSTRAEWTGAAIKHDDFSSPSLFLLFPCCAVRVPLSVLLRFSRADALLLQWCAVPALVAPSLSLDSSPLPSPLCGALSIPPSCPHRIRRYRSPSRVCSKMFRGAGGGGVARLVCDVGSRRRVCTRAVVWSAALVVPLFVPLLRGLDCARMDVTVKQIIQHAIPTLSTTQHALELIASVDSSQHSNSHVDVELEPSLTELEPSLTESSVVEKSCRFERSS